MDSSELVPLHPGFERVTSGKAGARGPIQKLEWLDLPLLVLLHTHWVLSVAGPRIRSNQSHGICSQLELQWSKRSQIMIRLQKGVGPHAQTTTWLHKLAYGHRQGSGCIPEIQRRAVRQDELILPLLFERY